MAIEKKLFGQDYSTPDLVAKMTGKARYAEDFRAEGMLFAKLLLSPMPHARVRSIDLSAALAMDGVKAILTADDLPATESPLDERSLTNEPLYQGEPIVAVAAVDEPTAARRHREDQAGSRAAAVRDRSAREPPSGRPERPRGRKQL